MEHFSDPSESRTDTIIRDLELGRGIFEKMRRGVVFKYLKDHKKKLQKGIELRPECLMIVKNELGNLKWKDECLEKWVINMFMGADVSQLESFYCRYNNTKRNKSSFFLMFIKNEL